MLASIKGMVIEAISELFFRVFSLRVAIFPLYLQWQRAPCRVHGLLKFFAGTGRLYIFNFSSVYECRFILHYHLRYDS